MADAIEAAVTPLEHLDVFRHGNTIVARTDRGRAQRVAIAGHIDTVPINANLPTRDIEIDGVPYLWGRGTVDMKAGTAVQLKLAAELTDPAIDITWMWYDNEEIEASKNGLGLLASVRPDLFEADFAILGEPSNGEVEGGCNGTLRALVRTSAACAPTAHAPGSARTRSTAPRHPHPAGGVPRQGGAGRGAAVPRELERGAHRGWSRGQRDPGHVRGRGQLPVRAEQVGGRRRGPSAWSPRGLRHRDHGCRRGARPGLDAEIAKQFVAAVGAEPRPKYGWTDVARFSALGIPARELRPRRPASRPPR